LFNVFVAVVPIVIQWVIFRDIGTDGPLLRALILSEVLIFFNNEKMGSW